MPMSTKRKAPAKLAAPVVKASATRPTKSVIDESRTSVSGTDALHSSKPETIEISSDADSEEDVSEEEESEEAEQKHQVNGSKAASRPGQVNGKQAAKLPSPMEEDGADSDDGEGTSPTFGELLRGTETIDVPALMQQSTAASSAAAQPAQSLIAPPNQSLTTVLSQALRTDDVDLLESCLHTTDLPTIRNTIERIDSALAGTLLNKLAARLYRRPGRAGHLMTWVQWTLVAHGGALASQPKVIHGLNGLQKVLAERAKGLNSLLALKGKLDLLEGQMDLRRKMQRGEGLLRSGSEDSEEEDVIYVEGEDAALPNGLRKTQTGDDFSSDDEGMPLTNGVVGDSDSEDDVSAADGDDSDDGEEELDEDEVQYEDGDESMGEDEESDAEGGPPAKMQKVASSFGRRK